MNKPNHLLPLDIVLSLPKDQLASLLFLHSDLQKTMYADDRLGQWSKALAASPIVQDSPCPHWIVRAFSRRFMLRSTMGQTPTWPWTRRTKSTFPCPRNRTLRR